MPEPERLRVKDKDTGHKRTIASAVLPHGNYEVLKSDAVDPVTGDDVPPEYAERAPDASYADWTVPDLTAEVSRRNEDRDPDDQVHPEGPGNKPQIIAALEADDETQNSGRQADNQKEQD